MTNSNSEMGHVTSSPMGILGSLNDQMTLKFQGVFIRLYCFSNLLIGDYSLRFGLSSLLRCLVIQGIPQILMVDIFILILVIPFMGRLCCLLWCGFCSLCRLRLLLWR